MMKSNRRPERDYGQQQHDHEQRQERPAPAPGFRSAYTATFLASELAARRHAIEQHRQQAAVNRQKADEQSNQIASREQLINDKKQEIKEFVAAKEREIASIGVEIERMRGAERGHQAEAERETAAQNDAELAVVDLESLLHTHAPAALSLPAAGDPNATRAETSGPQPTVTGAFSPVTGAHPFTQQGGPA
ncbi:hypothetical protein ACFHW2_12190 [Actinomadura sp. LOL_016]|uniref:hypothetical protein n=1 Tax=unclassified Actinomadura TaxID=2626254 RepID=UPI003A812C36